MTQSLISSSGIQGPAGPGGPPGARGDNGPPVSIQTYKYTALPATHDTLMNALINSVGLKATIACSEQEFQSKVLGT